VRTAASGLRARVGEQTETSGWQARVVASKRRARVGAAAASTSLHLAGLLATASA